LKNEKKEATLIPRMKQRKKGVFKPTCGGGTDGEIQGKKVHGGAAIHN